jgi:drug/metabolite transporter (DMT)-like permease
MVSLWFVLALVSALFSGAAAVMEKYAVKRWPVFWVTFLMSIFNLAFVIPVWFSLPERQLALYVYGLVAAKSLLQAGSFYCIMKAFELAELSATLPLMALTPALVGIVGWLLFGDRLGSMAIAGVGLTIAGTYILQLQAKQRLFDPWVSIFKTKSSLLMVAALTLSASTSLIDKMALSRVKLEPWRYLILEAFFQLFIYAFIWWWSKRKQIQSPMQSWKALVLSALGLSLCTIAWRYTQFSAVQLVPVAAVVSVKRLSIFFAALFGGLLFKESHLVRRLVAVGLLLWGASLLAGGV